MNNQQKLISMLQTTVRTTRADMLNPAKAHPSDAAYLEKTTDELSRQIREATQETIKIDTKNFHIEVTPDTAHGWFEHHERGDEYGGGLSFNGKELTDYDGVFELPQEVVSALQSAGYDLSYVMDDDDDGEDRLRLMEYGLG